MTSIKDRGEKNFYSDFSNQLYVIWVVSLQQLSLNNMIINTVFLKTVE